MTPVFGPLDEPERIAWLRLSRSDGIGPLTFMGLLQRFGTATEALAALPNLSRQAGRAVRVADRDVVMREIEQATKRGLRFVAWGEPDYPSALRAIEAAPPVLCVRGDLAVLKRPMVAVVGSRNASAAGLLFTERLAHGIGTAGYVVVSGLARGVDGKAHRAALMTGTVAVLAGGHARIYPPEHEGLAREISEAGAVLSEMPLAWEPRGRDFPRRNRIVSGLSLGTVVVEAARRSGSLITARLANEQGREVFAVPGSPLDPRAEGTNDLIRQGATLCTRPEDVVEALSPGAAAPLMQHTPHRLRDDPGFDFRALIEDTDDEADGAGDTESTPPGNFRAAHLDAEARVMQLLGPAPTTIDDLVRLSGLSAAEIRTVLMDLELTGVLDRRNDAFVSKARG
ncbi:DNA-processing protein DprA [Lichenifustis flavocetrariae]|uniref:DNA-processing protein DprA n=1 Tax=Lichenifustis flavocetrariae TaxID=2949735 RepID=A0AA41YXQ0_9HYPH|nr:DNA-processing protein DprA [Lichenifustis flavocetrariae]MCW6509176.1 DNA-processing protein DprA [Lichenifustis flavocetrariae]